MFAATKKAPLKGAFFVAGIRFYGAVYNGQVHHHVNVL
jgi:hypothetical protein